MWKSKVSGLIFVSVVAISACINPQDKWTIGIVFNSIDMSISTFEEPFGTKGIHYFSDSAGGQPIIKYKSEYDTTVMVVFGGYAVLQHDDYSQAERICPRLLCIIDSSSFLGSKDYSQLLGKELVKLCSMYNELLSFDSLAVEKIKTAIAIDTTAKVLSALENIDTRNSLGWVYWQREDVIYPSDYFLTQSNGCVTNCPSNCDSNYCIDAWDGCGIDIKYELPESTITTGVLSNFPKNRRNVGLIRNSRMKRILHFTSPLTINNASKMLCYDLRGQKIGLRQKCISQGCYIRLDKF